MTFYGNAPLPLKVHIVKHLLLQIALANRSGKLQKSVSQCALAVVDMGNDAKITYILHRKNLVLKPPAAKESTGKF